MFHAVRGNTRRRRALVLLAALLVSCGAPSAGSIGGEAAPRAPATAPPPRPAPSSSPTPPPSPTPPAPAPPLLGGEPAPRLRGELAMRTFSLDFYRLDGGMEADVIRTLALEAEAAVISGSERIGGFLSGRVSIRFEPPQRGACAIRGLTSSNERTIRLFYEPDTDPGRVVAILAHELFHQLQHDYYGETAHRRSDVILLEGMATWGSSPYFEDSAGQPRYRVAVRQALAEGGLLPLTTDLEADCRTTTRDVIYDEWASFVEYLLGTYGRERLDAAYRASTGRAAGSANYRGVYGKSLAELEAEWIAWLERQ